MCVPKPFHSSSYNNTDFPRKNGCLAVQPGIKQNIELTKQNTLQKIIYDSLVINQMTFMFLTANQIAQIVVSFINYKKTFFFLKAPKSIN